MPDITSSSSLNDVLLALNARMSIFSADWGSAIDKPTGSVADWTAKVGLFGDELTEFWANCATVGYFRCNPADFAAYSGWAIGVEFTIN